MFKLILAALAAILPLRRGNAFARRHAESSSVDHWAGQ
jgi:hypothetical protein